MAAVAAAGPIRIQLTTRDGVRAPGDPPEGTPTTWTCGREGLTGSPMVTVDGTQRWGKLDRPYRGRHRPHGSVVTVNPRVSGVETVVPLAVCAGRDAGVRPDRTLHCRCATSAGWAVPLMTEWPTSARSCWPRRRPSDGVGFTRRPPERTRRDAVAPGRPLRRLVGGRQRPANPNPCLGRAIAPGERPARPWRRSIMGSSGIGKDNGERRRSRHRRYATSGGRH